MKVTYLSQFCFHSECLDMKMDDTMLIPSGVEMATHYGLHIPTDHHASACLLAHLRRKWLVLHTAGMLESHSCYVHLSYHRNHPPPLHSVSSDPEYPWLITRERVMLIVPDLLWVTRRFLSFLIEILKACITTRYSGSVELEWFGLYWT